MEDISGQVLDNLLDNLDRLYDRLCTPADTQALLIASAGALADAKWTPTLLAAAEAIQAYPKRDLGYPGTLTDQGWYDHALAVTDEVRHAVATDWERRQGQVSEQSRLLLAQADVVGLPVAEARERVEGLGLSFKVAEPEDVRSWSPKRVTVEVADGVVQQAHVG